MRVILAVGLLGALGGWGWQLHAQPQYGPRASFALISGAAFGILLQRTRFCWFCNVRDLVTRRDARPALGLLMAILVGTLGYAAVFGAWVADPSAGYLPPKAHIGPVSWVVAVGGLLFGIGMTLSGSCISAHLYRLGEGSVLSPFALLGTVGGFMAGYRAWDWLYLNTLSTSSPIWLPTKLGYAQAVGLQVVVLAVAILLLLRYGTAPAAEPPQMRSWRAIGRAILVDRWPGWVGGGLIGVLGVLVLIRTQPLGVTAEISRLSREIATQWGLIDTRLEGIDGFAGCRAVAVEGVTFTGNALFILALVIASLASALIANQFRPRWEHWSAILFAVLGGVLLGFGAMISLGCSIGNALSGTMAMAVSGWVFLATMLVGLIATLPLRKWLIR